MKDALPVILILGLAYMFKDQLSGLLSGSGDSTVTGSVVGGYIPGPTKPGDFTSDALDVTGNPDNPTTGYQVRRQAYADRITVLSDTEKQSNPGALADVEQIEAREGIPGNEQILRASYERLWAYRLNKLMLPVSEYTRLRQAYISRYGGQEPNPNLSRILTTDQANIAVIPETYLNYVNRVRQMEGLTALAGLGCGRSSAGGCGCGSRADSGGTWA